jgi:hypothetical protein
MEHQFGTTQALPMTAILAVVASVAITGAQPRAIATPTPIIVYKTSTCGCCAKWVEHMRQNEFQPTVHDVSAAQVRAVSKAAGLPEEGTSCHTAKVGNYIVEGHVPASDVWRMLKEKLPIAGIAAPGMPIGSPGMEMGHRSQRYDVVSFMRDGKTTVFATHGR